MNTEDSEFQRIEAEAKRRAQAAEDDDTQVYTSNVALDNEQAAKIEQLEKKLAERSAGYLAAHITYDKGYQAGRQDAEDTCEYHKNRAARWRAEAYKQGGHDVIELPWIGLTDAEIEQGCKESWVTEQAWQSAVWWAEAALKEKNNG